MDKKKLTEQDIRTKFITPAIVNAGWDVDRQIREEVFFTDGKVVVRGESAQRGQRKKSDYILYYKANLPIAIVEAKDNNHGIGDGMQQGLDYAEILDIPFVYSSNGDGFIEHDRTVDEGNIEREITLEQFPSPETLYERYRIYKGLTVEQDQVVKQPYFTSPTGKTPRYYQRIAVNKTVEAIIKGQDRILLVMATGTGKTFTAFQIMWRLWKAGKKKRILFLSDRNILVDDPMRRDFAPFGERMVKFDRSKFDISKYSAYEIFLGLYQSLTGTEEHQKIYKKFDKDFFDLIVIDEAHRGSASADSAWREILEYFSQATQVGMTATPKQESHADNIAYFGEPVYTYSLKQGIEDGFLAPYRVVRVTIDKDVEGYRPRHGSIDKYGYEIPDEQYNTKDFDKKIVIDERTKIVAKKVTEYLQSTDPYAKTIVFCIDIEHAERMRRALINENAKLFSENSKYVMRITGDNEQGKWELDNFIDPEKKYPVIVTTSKLLTTGVDAKTTKLIVLDTVINSISEFKQIIGRGTRLDSEFNKYYFTIMDFRQATRLFADPQFDGPAFSTLEVSDDEDIKEKESEYAKDDKADDDIPMVRDGDRVTIISDPWDVTIDEDGTTLPKKYYVDDVFVKVLNETVQYYGEDGNLTTESVKDYSRKNILKKYRSLDAFVKDWSEADRKTAIIEELESHGVFFDELKQEVGKELDAFDLILHIAFDKPPLTRRERANNVKKKNYFAKYEGTARKVLEALLEKYADEGIEPVENMEVLNVKPFTTYGKPVEIVLSFGGRSEYQEAVEGMEKLLYMNA